MEEKEKEGVIFITLFIIVSVIVIVILLRIIFKGGELGTPQDAAVHKPAKATSWKSPEGFAVAQARD